MKNIKSFVPFGRISLLVLTLTLTSICRPLSFVTEPVAKKLGDFAEQIKIATNNLELIQSGDKAVMVGYSLYNARKFYKYLPNLQDDIYAFLRKFGFISVGAFIGWQIKNQISQSSAFNRLVIPPQSKESTDYFKLQDEPFNKLVMWEESAPEKTQVLLRTEPKELKSFYVLHGPPGTGKTSLLQAYRSKYPNTVIFQIPADLFDLNKQQHAFLCLLDEYIRLLRENPNVKILFYIDEADQHRGVEDRFLNNLLERVFEAFGEIQNGFDTIAELFKNFTESKNSKIGAGAGLLSGTYKLGKSVLGSVSSMMGFFANQDQLIALSMLNLLIALPSVSAIFSNPQSSAIPDKKIISNFFSVFWSMLFTSAIPDKKIISNFFSVFWSMLFISLGQDKSLSSALSNKIEAIVKLYGGGEYLAPSLFLITNNRDALIIKNTQGLNQSKEKEGIFLVDELLFDSTQLRAENIKKWAENLAKKVLRNSDFSYFFEKPENIEFELVSKKEIKKFLQNHSSIAGVNKLLAKSKLLEKLDKNISYRDLDNLVGTISELGLTEEKDLEKAITQALQYRNLLKPSK